MNLKQTIRRILREQTESGGGIFYHNSDYDFNSFNTQIKKDKKTNYLFFSNEPNTFIDRKYTYKVKLQFDPNKIFNTFEHINDYGIKYTLENYKDEVLELFEDNLSYFLNEWEKTGVDSINEVMEYYIDAGGDEDDMVGLLYYFLTKFNDSWAIIETNKFLDFIESKGFNGFVTHEEGLINIACKDFKSIEIIGKKEMWSDDGEGVKSLKEDINKKQNAIQVYIDEYGLKKTIEEFGSLFSVAKKLNLTPKELFEKYNIIDEAVKELKRTCERNDEDNEYVSYSACDFIEVLTEVEIVDIKKDNTIELKLRYQSIFNYLDEYSFIYELKHELKNYGDFEIEVIYSINTRSNRQW
jgi:hypothetical protein